MEKLVASIVTPYGEIFSGEVDSVTLPGVEGEFGVLYGHVNLLSLLKAGVIELDHNGQKELVAIDWGYAEIASSKVDIIINGAVSISGKDENSISNAISNAKKLLEEASDDRIAISSVVSKIEQTKNRF
ncbi:ATP synthase F1 subunit epsilon [Helicobacter fennelliae]|uniref:ATP synthase epsilon chain n=2 Tax=Helicobacter fennelliae TaxID=215 RepID=T1DV67_9HELI|nr:ATP synthase F1 subunit epsilon [Helicobacter fennelliae]GAD18468.1 ATP synthase epsilon chain [Helicobacter fennelliae MRY12-0050]SQB98822.1 F0F1 ATP synthase subunit epsilon [Helicobacter fennelliae]STP08165.1 F0F1 ATP synthase subunit epsilon [Helicobacter fennelliae]STQ83927.1 F0F1 ATP synthase subunit epsilon [Helicobacter fennelliae]